MRTGTRLALLTLWFSAIGLQPMTAGADPLPEPTADAFYDAPAGFATAAPGTVFRTRPVALTFYGIPTPITATQALFRTADSHDAPVTAVTTVIPSSTPRPGHPVISYQIAIDGLAAQCNPSYRLRIGTEGDLRVLVMLLQQGYGVVVTDHQGPRNAYGAGKMSGRATLDGIRAAESLPDTGFDGVRTPVAMWGYSGGALATGWAAQLQPSYAPELNVKAVAAGGTPADLQAAGRQMNGGPASSVYLMGVIGVSREYPDMQGLRDLLNDQGRQAEQVLSGRCIEEGAIAYPFRQLGDFTIVPNPLDDPRVQKFFAELKLGAAAPTAPVYLYHAVYDEGMPFAAAQQLARDWCAGGSKVWFQAEQVAEHLSLSVTETPAVLKFFADRFAGLPAPTNC
ncbi:lipase family protein [Antrihabitans cavernicola]|nr:lipase family protein [Spelaeibacter cavernicola]